MFTFSIGRLTVDASVSGGNGDVSPLTQDVDYGDPASITFTPASGYHLASITDNGADVPISGITSPYVIASVIVDHTVVFTFSPVIGPLESGNIIIYWSLDEHNAGRVQFVSFKLDIEFSGIADENKKGLSAGKRRLIITLDPPYNFGAEPVLSLTPGTRNVLKGADFTVNLEIEGDIVGIITMVAKNKPGTYFIKIDGTQTVLLDVNENPIPFSVDGFVNVIIE